MSPLTFNWLRFILLLPGHLSELLFRVSGIQKNEHCTDLSICNTIRISGTRVHPLI